MTADVRPVVVLVGPPGAGKSTVAALLAESLGVEVRDTDTDIETATGTPIADLFVTHGEAHFRALEVDAVATALGEHRGVLALGGGAVMRDETQAALRGHTVVFLDVGLAEAASRVGLSSARPLLLGNVRSQMKALLDSRRPTYEAVATHVISTDGRTPTEVAEEILTLLG
ncbi:shikimate kinase [Mumia zhuanghuii]|uniref:Shikimate kinase n=2 Tax=Mumia TaxID=1546255 RepID=A0ABW1QKM5_9ACTN|nr:MULTISPECIES: shikimate kinase [Mumia]KAA1423266.1 shikimate kinase [Mumia zhuanghuii]